MVIMVNGYNGYNMLNDKLGLGDVSKWNKKLE
jgi:hypothetical protein